MAYFAVSGTGVPASCKRALGEPDGLRLRLSRCAFPVSSVRGSAVRSSVPGVNTDDLVHGCFPCDQQAAAFLPPREDVVHTDHWRVAHAFNSTLPGWLVLLPTRHVTSFTDLTPEAADELGGLIRRLAPMLQ